VGIQAIRTAPITLDVARGRRIVGMLKHTPTAAKRPRSLWPPAFSRFGGKRAEVARRGAALFASPRALPQQAFLWPFVLRSFGSA